MINFNFMLFIFDILVVSSPFLSLEMGWITASYFFLGVALNWIFLNLKNKKINVKRYKYY